MPEVDPRYDSDNPAAWEAAIQPPPPADEWKTLAIVVGLILVGPYLLRGLEAIVGPSDSEKRIARHLQRRGKRVKRRYRRYR